MTDSPIPLPDNEYERLLALARYEVLDSLPEETFDRLTELVAETLGVPAVRVNFVDQQRVWTKARYGPPPVDDARAGSLCTWTVMSREVTVIPDIVLDERFAPQGPVRMYAGAPLISAQGHAIGTLCVGRAEPLGAGPSVFGAREQRLLQMFASVVMDELELRLHNIELGRQMQLQEQQQRELARTLSHAQTLMSVTEQFSGGPVPPEAARNAAALLGQAVSADWCGLIELRPGHPAVRLAWRHPAIQVDVMAALAEAGVRQDWLPQVMALRGGLYIDDYAAYPGAVMPLLGAEVAGLVVRPLGSFDGTDYLLLALRFGAARPWLGSDRALIEAAAGSVSSALHQSSHLRRVEWAASTDSLTGLGNRRAHDEYVKEHARQIGQVAFIDLDGMKVLNDREGHAAGDRMLTGFSQQMRAAFPPEVRLHRIGGDEFAVLVPLALLPPGGCGAHISEAVERVVRELNRLGFLSVGASVGVACVGTAGVEEALREADALMYAEKRRRREKRAAPAPS